MMKPHRSTRFVKSFTLIELILAVGIMAIVLASINAAFFTGLRLRNRTTDAVDEAMPAQQTLSVLQRDLKCAMPAGGPLSGDFKVGTISEPNMSQPAAIEIYTATGALRANQPWADVQMVTYELKDPTTPAPNGGKDLVRSVTRNLLNQQSADVDEQRMMSGVSDIQFECYDGTQWLDTWDTTMSNTNLPVAVRVRIELAGAAAGPGDSQPIEIVVPIDSQSPTNQIPTAAGGGS